VSDGDSIHASEETDIQVAREVFGLEVREMWLWTSEDSETGSRRFESVPPENDLDRAVYTAEKHWCFNDPGIGWKFLPAYSRHVLTAFLVVEHFRRGLCCVVLEGENWLDGGGGYWYCKIIGPGKHEIMAAGRDETTGDKEPSFALAVCRAALRYTRISRGEK
jgi:hypothetical protein